MIHRKRKTYQINLMIILGFKLEAFSEYWHRERKNTMVSLNLRRQKWELRETGADYKEKEITRERDPEICMGIPLSDWLHN